MEKHESMQMIRSEQLLSKFRSKLDLYKYLTIQCKILISF